VVPFYTVTLHCKTLTSSHAVERRQTDRQTYRHRIIVHTALKKNIRYFSGSGDRNTLSSLPHAPPSLWPSATWLHYPPGGRLPLLSARSAVTFPAEEHHRPSASTKLYCLVTVAHGCEQLPKVATQQSGCRGSNSRPLSHDALTTRLSSQPIGEFTKKCINKKFGYNSAISYDRWRR